MNFKDHGGPIPPGPTRIDNTTGRPEFVMVPDSLVKLLGNRDHQRPALDDRVKHLLHKRVALLGFEAEVIADLHRRGRRNDGRDDAPLTFESEPKDEGPAVVDAARDRVLQRRDGRRPKAHIEIRVRAELNRPHWIRGRHASKSTHR